MRTAVTGGAGFIGHHLVGGLLARGHQVNVIDDFSTGERSHLTPFAIGIAITEGSILDPAALDEAIADREVVFHHAAIASVAQSLVAPRMTNDVNAGGTIEVMLAAARHGVRRVVFAGSSSVYGIPAELPCRESQRPDPQSPYGASKLAAEHYVHTLSRLHGVETVVLRYFNVFGPGQDPASEYAAVVPRFITAILEGRRPIIYGTGEHLARFRVRRRRGRGEPARVAAVEPVGPHLQHRDRLADQPHGAAPGGLRRGRPRRRSGLRSRRPGDIEHSQADISCARQMLGYA